jgi:hypothetical protein
VPEYHNVQAYLSLDHREHRDAIALFSQVLSAVTTRTEAGDAWLSSITDELSLNEGYAPSGPRLVTSAGAHVLEVRPLVHRWTADVIPHLCGSWLEVGLLLDSERIELPGLEEPRYRPELEAVLFQLVTAFLPVSIDAPTFLTNEATDGSPWEAFTGGDADPWTFDLAVAHAGLAWPQAELPPEFEWRHHDGGTVIIRSAAWSMSPDR